jgi:dihydropteroate synthase
LTEQPKILSWPTGRLDFSQAPLLMGILNITSDSFSDGGDFLDPSKAVERALEMAEQGAAIVDIGAQSTRPGAAAAPAAEQIKRAVAVIEKLTGQIRIPISIDANDPEVALAAVEAGASILNDITALADPRMAVLAAEKKVPVILMHMQGTPQTMQINPQYKDVTAEVLAFLRDRAQYAESMGIAKENIFVDPGIGFGKTTAHNLQLLRDLNRFSRLGYRVLVGVSRKRFIGQITGRQAPKERGWGTAAAAALAAAGGADILRVHDVREMLDVVKITHAILTGFVQ